MTGKKDTSSKMVAETSARDRLRDGLIVAGMTLVVLSLSLYLLRELRTILQPLLIAMFACYLIVPAHRWLVRHRLPSVVSHFVIVGAFLSVVTVGGLLAYQGLNQLGGELPGHISALDALVQSKMNAWEERLSDLIERTSGKSEGESDESIEDLNEPFEPFEAEVDPLDETEEPIEPEPVRPPPTRPTESKRWISSGQVMKLAGETVNTFLGLSTSLLVIVFYLFFLLAEVATFQRRLANAVGQERSGRVLSVISTINSAVSRYIAVKTFVSALVAGLSFVIMYFMDVRYALIWALLTFFANFIPYIGSLAAVMLPVVLSLVQFGGDIGRTVMLALLLIGAQTLVGNVLEPRIIGKRLGVSPLVILLALAFWGFIWGVPGMILSAPLAVSIKIVLENVEQTRPIGRFLSNV